MLKNFCWNPPRPLNALKRPYFVPESIRIDDLLQELQHKKSHMAIVTDEYGVTSGVVTIEDILEEIVGEAFEDSQGDEAVQRLNAQGLRLLGRSRIRELNRRFGLDIPSGEPDTLGGYVMSLFGNVPEVGEHIDDGKLEFRVLKLSGRRVDALQVRRLPRPPGGHTDATDDSGEGSERLI